MDNTRTVRREVTPMEEVGRLCVWNCSPHCVPGSQSQRITSVDLHARNEGTRPIEHLVPLGWRVPWGQAHAKAKPKKPETLSAARSDL